MQRDVRLSQGGALAGIECGIPLFVFIAESSSAEDFLDKFFTN
jgi:hypothetical protein